MDKAISFFLILKNAAIFVGKWIEDHSDFVTAAASATIALFTLTLWWTTRRLWKVSQEQSRDMKESLRIAQEAADAAKASADTLPAIERAYLFVKITMENPDQEGIAGIIDESPRYNTDNVKIIITNHGKTPAILIKHPYTTEVLTNDEIDEKIAKFASKDIDTWLPVGPVIIDAIDNSRTLSADFFMTKQKWHEITMNKAYLTCLGCLHYKDIFEKPHKTVFCWKYEQFSGFHYDKDPKRNYSI